MIIILDNIRSALNVGSIIRTCDAFGIKEIYFCGITPGKDDPKVKKTALGAEAAIKEKDFAGINDAIKAARDLEYAIVALENTKGSIPIESYNPKKDIALIVGNEVSGVDVSALKLADEILEIKMEGKKESLNVSVATGIAIYHLTRCV